MDAKFSLALRLSSFGQRRCHFLYEIDGANVFIRSWTTYVHFVTTFKRIREKGWNKYRSIRSTNHLSSPWKCIALIGPSALKRKIYYIYIYLIDIIIYIYLIDLLTGDSRNVSKFCSGETSYVSTKAKADQMYLLLGNLQVPNQFGQLSSDQSSIGCCSNVIWHGTSWTPIDAHWTRTKAKAIISSFLYLRKNVETF